MSFTREQILELAPDSASAAAGQKLAAARHWQSLGRDASALWGLCQGSALYQVKIDATNFGYHCSCPSRKFPCKHVMGLLLLAAAAPEAVVEGAVPEWVAQWLARREAKAQKKTDPDSEAPKKPVDEKAQKRRVAERETLVREGLDRLDLWLKDLVRNGLAGLETKPASFWDEQARRLVDAQAPGLASRVARLAAIPAASSDWPGRLLKELAGIKLLIQAYGRGESLGTELHSDVRQLVGWNVAQADLEQQGERVADTWAVVGQWIDDEARVRAQRSWIVGRDSGRMALVLQFSAGGQPFAEAIVPGSQQRGVLAFYPGAARLRAKFVERSGSVEQLSERAPGLGSIDELLALAAERLATQPWAGACGCVLHDVTLTLERERWFVCDRTGQAIPLLGREHWKLLALTGARPFDLAGEWDGEALRPLGLFHEGSFRVA